MKVRRFSTNPLVTTASHPSIGSNVNGPSVIRVPDWIPNPLGRYYLYFAHHQGTFIRLAYADALEGPWRIHAAGTLRIEDCPFTDHIASPDVHVDHERRRIWMLYHGCGLTLHGDGQKSAYAESSDGLAFKAEPFYLGEPYLRAVQIGGWWYYSAGGPTRRIYRSRLPGRDLEAGNCLPVAGVAFKDSKSIDLHDPGFVDSARRMRHLAFRLWGNSLDIFFSAVGDAPERIRRTRVNVANDWLSWRGGEAEEVLRSETDYEGAGLAVVPSVGGAKHGPVHELRDPYVFREDGKSYLFYSVAGEQGIAGAELIDTQS